LADYNSALKIDATLEPALLNKAIVLADAAGSDTSAERSA